ncbi:MAG: hypothetical protein HKN46_01285 [Acidimicrobiia bacterium]|nr:hypothetical protein [Acidimicrobiia bacterium]
MSSFLEVRVRDGSGAAFLAEQTAFEFFEEAGVDRADVLRIHVPGRGQETEWTGSVRSELAPLIPALQSVSLFGDIAAVLLLEAQQLQVGEAETLAELLAGADPEAVRLVVVSEGATPAKLAKALAAAGAAREEIKTVRDSAAASWLAGDAKQRGLRLDGAARAALLEVFGTNLAAMSSALDQLEGGPPPTADEIRSRFRSRPDEPLWLFTEALDAGDSTTALRRLRDILVHGHPLQLLGFLEGDLRRRSLAVSAPDIETFAEWVGGRASDFRTKKDWSKTRRTSATSLRRATDALSRADRTLKTAPEDLHRVTMERLTVALAIWYSGRS